MSLRQHTRDWIVKRMTESNIDSSKIELDPEIPQDLNQEELEAWVTDAFEVVVIFGGALDEEFYVKGMYEVNVADWVAEDCVNECIKQPGEFWEVYVYKMVLGWDNEGFPREFVYKVTNETFGG